MPVASASDDIVMRLILKNQEPGEAARLARMPLDAVRAEYAAAAQKIQAGFDAMHAATTKEATKAAKDEIKIQQDKTRQIVAALKEVEREHAKASKTMSTNWRRTLEDLENISVVGRTAFDFITGAMHKAKALADETIRTTNIYRSLKGSIQEASEATDGTVADMDLIIAKNAALSAGLNVSSTEFAEIAKAADAYADAVGQSAKEALDPFVASLAAGNERMLKRIGVLVDATAAEKRYAAINEQSVESLTEQQKRAAFVDEAMKQIIAKNQTLNNMPPTVADRLEQGFAGVKNVIDRIIAGIGNIRLPAALDDTLSQFGRLAMLMAKDDTSGDPFRSMVKASMAVSYGLDTRDAALAKITQQGADFNRKLSPDEESDAATKFLEGGKRRRPTKLKPESITYVSPDTVTGLDRLFYKAALDEQERIVKIQEEAWDAAFDKGRKELAEHLENLGTGKNGDLIPFAGTAATADYRRDFATAQGKAAKALQFQQASGVSLRDAKGSANLDEDFIRDLEAKIADSREKAGGGLIGQLLFGDDTSMSQTYDKLDEAKRRTIDTIREMSDFASGAAEQMAGALGSSLAASIGEGKGLKAALKEQTHAVLMSISTQAFTKAAWHTALALGDLAMLNFPGAAANGAAAAAFLGVGVLAGAGARASYSAPASTPPSSSRSAPSYASGSGGGGSSSGGGGGDTTIVFNINGMIGDSEAIIREVGRGVDQFRRKTGRSPWGDN